MENNYRGEQPLEQLGGLLHGVLGVVLETVGVDVRVRLFLPIGGVTELALPVLGGAKLPAGAQVVALFLADRPESGVVLGGVEGAISWRRLTPPALAEEVLPALQRIGGKCDGRRGRNGVHAGAVSFVAGQRADAV